MKQRLRRWTWLAIRSGLSAEFGYRDYILSPDLVYNFLLQVQASKKEVWPAPIVDFASFKFPLSNPGLSSESFRLDRFLGALDAIGCMILSRSKQEEGRFTAIAFRSPC